MSERRLAAILTADVSGYSRLMGEDEESTVAILQEYRAVFAREVAAHDGRIIDTAGDSVICEFASVVNAVQTAVRVQEELSRRNEALPAGRRMHFRIGVNVGDVIALPDGSLYGDGVNIAARLESLAPPGGLCISGLAFDQVEGKFNQLRFAYTGEHAVKNIRKPVRAYVVESDEASGVDGGDRGSPLQAGGARAGRRSGSAGAALARPGSRQRLLLAGAGLVLVCALVAGLLAWRRGPSGPEAGLRPRSLAGRTPIRVGVLHSLTGTMAISERAVVDSVLLAIEEINAAGGVLSRPVEPIVVDGKSDVAEFVRGATRLILDDKVVTVFGAWTSASRKAIKPIFEEHDHLLIYPVQYEGLEDSQNIIYLGALPNQQALPGMRYCAQALGKRRVFLVGSDYIFPRSVNAVLRDAAQEMGVTIVGEAYVLLSETRFGAVIQGIQKARPDLIINTINGDSNVPFFRSLREAGIRPGGVPTISLSIGENELQQLSGIELTGDYLAGSYFQRVEREENRVFLRRFRDKYGAHRVTSDAMEAAYSGVKLWARAVEAAGDLDLRAIRRQLKGQRYQSPSAALMIDPSNNHAWKVFRMGRIGPGGEVEIVTGVGEPIEPVPFPATRTRAEWEALLDKFYAEWGHGWINPKRPNLLRPPADRSSVLGR